MSSRSLRWTPEQLQAHLRDRTKVESRAAPTVAASAAPAPRQSKYSNEKAVEDGIRFDSKKEAARYRDLKLLQAAGEIVWFTRQVPFYLPGGTKWICDFLVKWSHGEITVEDVKGMKTDAYRIKKREIEHHYPFKIIEI